MDAPAGHRLRHRAERGRALRRQPGPGHGVHDRTAQNRRAARESACRAGIALLAQGFPRRRARRGHGTAQHPRVGGGSLRAGRREPTEMTRSSVISVLILIATSVIAVLSVSSCSPAPPAAPAFPGGEIVDLSHAYDSTTIFWPTAEPFRLEKVSEGMTPGGYYY